MATCNCPKINKKKFSTALHTTRSSLSSHPLCKPSWVPRLQKDGPWSRELANQAFSGCYTGHNPPGGDALKNILCIPRNEMAVIDNVSLALLELLMCQQSSRDSEGVGNSHLSE